MKKLFSMLMMVVIGLGCYQLGRQPNSPDVVGWLKAKLSRVDWPTIGRRTDETLQYARHQVSVWCENQQSSALPAPAADRATPTNAPTSPSELSAADRITRGDVPPRQDLPQCW